MEHSILTPIFSLACLQASTHSRRRLVSYHLMFFVAFPPLVFNQATFSLQYCAAQYKAFNETDVGATKGGIKAMGEALDRGNG